jgi:hypothetical protein
MKECSYVAQLILLRFLNYNHVTGKMNPLYNESIAYEQTFFRQRNVSGEGHLNGKNPPPKKRVRVLAY